MTPNGRPPGDDPRDPTRAASNGGARTQADGGIATQPPGYADDRYARLAARALVPAAGATPVPRREERDSAIAALASAIATRRTRRNGRRVGIAAAAAAALAAAVVLVAGFGERARRDADRVTAWLDGDRALENGSVVQTEESQPRAVSLSTGTVLRLSPAGRMTVAEIGARQHFVLHAGRLTAKVAPLARGHRFLIATADAEIEVRGTAFALGVYREPPAGCGSLTALSVTEGLVTVRQAGRQWQVAAGQTWPRECSVAVETATRPDVAVSVAGPVSADAAAPRSAREREPSFPARHARGSTRADLSQRTKRQTPAAVSPSSLREQNDLFAAAVEARRRGDLATADRLLDDLLTRFPFGALADSARSELATSRRPRGHAADATR